MQGNTANSQAELALDTRAFVACLGTTTVGVTAQSAEPRREAVVSLQEQLIPTIAGRNLVAVVVDYQPDGTSPPHRHPGADLIYAHVLSGACPQPAQRRAAKCLSSRGELVRDARHAPQGQPECQRDRACASARRLCRRWGQSLSDCAGPQTGLRTSHAEHH